jgi:hypothetical protein
MERYVKNIKKWFQEESELGKIYDTSLPFPTHLNFCKNETWELVLSDDRYSGEKLGYKKWFIPATREEWDLQEGFYVKDILVEDLSYQEDLIRLLKNVK